MERDEEKEARSRDVNGPGKSRSEAPGVIFFFQGDKINRICDVSELKGRFRQLAGSSRFEFKYDKYIKICLILK